MAEKSDLRLMSEDEIEKLEEQDEREDKRFMEMLVKDKKTNYAMLRKLRPITNDQSLAIKELIPPYIDNYFESLKRLAEFKDWKDVEGGKVQIRESEDAEDMHGYVVIRPEDDQMHEIVIRVWDGFPNSAIFLPRSDQPLSHHGRQKEEILEQMRVVSGKELDAYNVWLERLRKAG